MNWKAHYCKDVNSPIYLIVKATDAWSQSNLDQNPCMSVETEKLVLSFIWKWKGSENIIRNWYKEDWVFSLLSYSNQSMYQYKHKRNTQIEENRVQNWICAYTDTRFMQNNGEWMVFLINAAWSTRYKCETKWNLTLTSHHIHTLIPCELQRNYKRWSNKTDGR